MSTVHVHRLKKKRITVWGTARNYQVYEREHTKYHKLFCRLLSPLLCTRGNGHHCCANAHNVNSACCFHISHAQAVQLYVWYVGRSVKCHPCCCAMCGSTSLKFCRCFHHSHAQDSHVWKAALLRLRKHHKCLPAAAAAAFSSCGTKWNGHVAIPTYYILSYHLMLKLSE